MKKLFYTILEFFGKLSSLLGKKGLHITIDLDDDETPELDVEIHFHEGKDTKKGDH